MSKFPENVNKCQQNKEFIHNYQIVNKSNDSYNCEYCVNNFHQDKVNSSIKKNVHQVINYF